MKTARRVFSCRPNSTRPAAAINDAIALDLFGCTSGPRRDMRRPGWELALRLVVGCSTLIRRHNGSGVSISPAAF